MKSGFNEYYYVYNRGYLCGLLLEQQIKPVLIVLEMYAVCRKPQNFSFVLSNAVVEPVRVRINAIPFIFFEADVQSFEIRNTA